MTDAPCPFCQPAAERIFYTGERVIGLWDAFPVSAGHALLIPKRHIADWFQADLDEQSELMRAIKVAKAVIETQHQPDGYNIGPAAGQTVFHLHVHVIPRYVGDVADPRGGVRHVIPAKANYLATTPVVGLVAAPAGDDPLLIRGGKDDPLLPHLVALLDEAQSVAIATAFTQRL